MKKCIWIVLLLFCVSFSAVAEGTPTLPSGLEIESAKGVLPKNAPPTLRKFDMTNPSLDTVFAQLFDWSGFEVEGVLQSNLALLSKLLVVLCICLVATLFTDGKYISQNSIQIIAVLTIMSLVLGNIKGQISQTIEVLSQIDVFSKLLMPAVMTSVMMTGQVMAVSSVGSVLTLSVFISFISGTLVKLLYLYLALVTINSCCEAPILLRSAELLKAFIQTSLKFFLTIFVAYNSIAAILSAGSSTAFIKAAKFAVSGSVPLVGGIISDATETFLSGAVLIKNSIGVFGLLGVLSICLYPVLRSALSCILFKVGSSLLSVFSENSIIRLMDGISTTLTMLLAMLVSAAGAFFFQIVIILLFVKGGL